MALAVGEERVTAFGERRAQADRRQRVLQRAPGAHVHVHAARRDERQSRGAGKRLERGQARAVAGAREELGGNPCAAGEDVGEPARDHRGVRLDFSRAVEDYRCGSRKIESDPAGGTHNARQRGATAATSSRVSE